MSSGSEFLRGIFEALKDGKVTRQQLMINATRLLKMGEALHG